MRLSLALLVALLDLGQAQAAGAQSATGQAQAPGHGDDDGEGHEAETPAVQPTTEEAPAAKRKSSRSRTRARATRSRSGAKVSGYVVPERKLRTAPLPRPSGNLHVHNASSGESLKVNIFNPDGSYNIETLEAATHILRCKRTDTERDIEPRLLAILSHVFDKFGERRIEVVSAYRNQRRTSSYHFKGSAVDIRLAGIKPTRLRAYLESLDGGGMGIGLYPRTGFVHIDVRPVPSYRWIDWSRSDPDAPDKRPPRGFKRKKLQS